MARIYSILTLLLMIALFTRSPLAYAADPPCKTASVTVCQFVNSTNRPDCESCVAGCGAYTAIGCLPSTPSGFIKKFFSFGIGIAGAIAFLLILFGGLKILTSAGNPEHLNEGKELVVSAISGLLMIIFSIFLLRLIGVDILGLPTFK